MCAASATSGRLKARRRNSLAVMGAWCTECEGARAARVRQRAILSHLDDDLASCAPRFEVSPSLFGGFEREDPIHHLPDDARFNEGCDLAQLLAVRSHEDKRVGNAVLLSERYIRRTGDGNELSTGLQHLEGLFERVLAKTVQDDVVAA